MTERKTISDLGVDVSIQWARDQKLLEETRTLNTDAPAIAIHTQKDVTTPSSLPLLHQLLGDHRVYLPWASFSPPAKFHQQFRNRLLFTSATAPSLGNDEQCEDKIARVSAITPVDEEDKQKQKTFEQVLTLLSKLNKDQIFALARINQYKKG